jgi:hypothetical protein
MNRNAIFGALFALTDITWGSSQTFAERGRRLKPWDKAPSPALYQMEGNETILSRDGQLDKRTLRANWIIYHRGGKEQSSTPSDLSNDILDALETALRPPMANARQTLGGLAYRVFIDGQIHKDNGDLDGQALLIVPITIIVP